MSAQQQALVAYRRQRLAQVLERHPCPDSPELADVPNDYINGVGEGAGHCPTYAAVVKHEGDGDHAIGVFQRQHEALRFLGCDYPEWRPHALYHLGTGESLGFEVRAKVGRSQLRVEDDLQL